MRINFLLKSSPLFNFKDHLKIYFFRLCSPSGAPLQCKAIVSYVQAFTSSIVTAFTLLWITQFLCHGSMRTHSFGVLHCQAHKVFVPLPEPLHRPYYEVWLLSPFLIGRMFLHEPSWKYLLKLYSGSKKLRSTCSGNIRPIRRSLPLIGWEHSSPVDEEKIKIKLDDGVARFFTRFGGYLFIWWLVGSAALSRRPRMK